MCWLTGSSGAGWLCVSFAAAPGGLTPLLSLAPPLLPVLLAWQPVGVLQLVLPSASTAATPMSWCAAAAGGWSRWSCTLLLLLLLLLLCAVAPSILSVSLLEPDGHHPSWPGFGSRVTAGDRAMRTRRSMRPLSRGKSGSCGLRGAPAGSCGLWGGGTV
jgi:hypothetical protein